MSIDLKTLLVRLYKEADFRRSFAQDPRSALRDLGFDVSSVRVPTKIELPDLERHLLMEDRTAPASSALSLEEIASLSDEQVWAKYKDKIQPISASYSDDTPPLFVSAAPPDTITPVAVYAVTIATIVGGSDPDDDPTQNPS